MKYLEAFLNGTWHDEPLQIQGKGETSPGAIRNGPTKLTKPVFDPRSQDDFEWLLDAPLSEFAQNNLVVKVYSEVLRENVFFASNAELADKVRKAGGVAYTPEELRQLWAEGVSPADLRAVHMVKKRFVGRIENETVE